MKTTFELKAWMTENRELVITEFEKLTAEKFYNGITLKEYMVKVYNTMLMNNPKSDKRAASLLPSVMGRISFNNSTVEAYDAVTERLRAAYKGTAYMAMV